MWWLWIVVPAVLAALVAACWGTGDDEFASVDEFASMGRALGGER